MKEEILKLLLVCGVHTKEDERRSVENYFQVGNKPKQIFEPFNIDLQFIYVHSDQNGLLYLRPCYPFCNRNIV